MGEQLLRFINVLKTVPEIKESIEELKFGCMIEYKNIMASYEPEDYPGDDIYTLVNEDGFMYGGDYISAGKGNGEGGDFGYINKIIGQVEERHLRMFLKEKLDTEKESIVFTRFGEIKHTKFKDGNEAGGFDYIISTLDNSKPFMEQDEIFYKTLCDWIEGEFDMG